MKRCFLAKLSFQHQKIDNSRKVTQKLKKHQNTQKESFLQPVLSDIKNSESMRNINITIKSKGTHIKLIFLKN